MKLTKNLPVSEEAHTLAVAYVFPMVRETAPPLHPAFSAEGVQVAAGKKRKRVLKNDELAKVLASSRDARLSARNCRAAFILTEQRRGEIGGLRWPWINEKERTITLPSEITKNGVEHTFPYNGRVAAIFAAKPPDAQNAT